MILALLSLLTCQLAGETLSRAFALPLPGPVLGMLLMLLALQFIPALADVMRPVAQGILSHMSLLFVPAGVGIVGHLDQFGGQGIGIVVAILGSTALAIAAGALTFSAVAKLTGNQDD